MSDTNVKELLSKVSSKGKQNDILKYMKTMALLQFLDCVCKPLLEHADTGISLRVSSKPDVVKKFVPFLLAFSVDSAEGYQICGTKAGHRKCRMCEALTYNFNPKEKPDIRTSNTYVSKQQSGHRYITLSTH